MNAERVYVVKPERVAFCLRDLRERKIHRHFAGYLCVKRTAVKERRTSDLSVDFTEFYDTFLSVPGGDKPYIYAFVEEPPSKHNRWQNPNLAGSYAPSSVRAASPFREVIEITGSGSRSNISYSLRDRHWELARKHLTYGDRVPAVSIALLLYRDYGLQVQPPSVSAWVRVFQDEFGYLDESGEPTEGFNHLYTDDSEHKTFEGWFDTLTPNEL